MDKDQIKKTLKSLPAQKNNIPGIYNYCDYWCERCMFTSRCANYQIGKELGQGDLDKDLTNHEYWENLGNMFKATMELLVEKMEELGIDPEEFHDEPDTRIKDVRKQPLVRRASSYSLKVHKWIVQYNQASEKSRTLHLIKGSKYARIVEESIEVINWYSIFISAKTSRAFSSGRYEEDETDRYDSDGSVKVTLMAIDRSMAAFTQLWEILKDHEDDILGFLVKLSSLKKGLLRRFPNAINFQRPGFDD